MTEGKKKPAMKMIGDMKCYSCERSIPVKEQSNGLASVSCNWCGFQSYARGEEADAQIRKRMTAKAAPAPAAEPKKEPDEQPKKSKSLLEL